MTRWPLRLPAVPPGTVLQAAPVLLPLRLVPLTVTDARVVVQRLHSHHEAPVGGLAAVGVEELAEEPRLVCAAVLSRPVARGLAGAAEVTRVASDRTPHAASKAVGAITRAALALGYRRLVSYTLLGEAGTCLRAAGWRPVARVRGREWDCAARPRAAASQPVDKIRWEYGPDAAAPEADIEEHLRAHVGRVDLRARRERLPLFDRQAAPRGSRRGWRTAMPIDPARCPVPAACAAGCGREIGLGPDADEGVPFVCLFCTDAGRTLPAPALPDAEVARASALLRSLPPGSGSGWPELQAAGYSRAVADAALRLVLAEERAA